VHGPSGVITGVGGVVLDVTDTKRAEEELRIAVRTREDIMAVVSHDLRTPVATVQLSATLLMSQLGTDHRAKRHLDMIHRACTRMESLIDDLLDTASIREGRLDIDAKRELIEEVVTEAVDLQVPLAEEKNIAVVRDYRLETIHVRCDRERIIQVFANIIGNALKFCRAGDTITVSGERVADEVRFAIANTGPAIDPDRLTRIFEAYWSAPEHRARGSGLGLYIVRGIIEHHGGRIWAESRPGSGATFVFSIPVDR
jgi:signal transduction histidine kinase